MRRTSLDVVDQELLSVREVPTHLVRHTPPARLNVARLMFCRDYRPGEEGSCGMGDGCKFVHADVDPATLESHPIHVKYAWRSEELCTYPRLPAGSVLRVTAPNNRPPIEEIASERVLVTRGALGEGGAAGPLSHCAHYYFNRMCNRGERCNFIHAVHVDPNVTGDFKRAPARCVVSCPRPSRPSGSKKAAPAAIPCDLPEVQLAEMYSGLQLEDCLLPIVKPGQAANFAPRSFSSTDLDERAMLFVSQSQMLSAAAIPGGVANASFSQVGSSSSSDALAGSAMSTISQQQPSSVYRRNPYSLRVVTVAVESVQ